MLNEPLLTLPISELKDVLFYDLSINHLALLYILMYVIYKALGRFVYFKPQEHSSKINRSFLTISLLIVILHTFSGILISLPFILEYRWLFALCSLLIFIIPLSIVMEEVIWNKDRGNKGRRSWTYYYLPVHQDYYKTTISKSETNGNSSSSWEEEGVESTQANMHSDTLLNVLALAVFIVISGYWTYESYLVYSWTSFAFFICLILPVALIFFDRAIFSWIDYLEEKSIK